MNKLNNSINVANDAHHPQLEYFNSQNVASNI